MPPNESDTTLIESGVPAQTPVSQLHPKPAAEAPGPAQEPVGAPEQDQPEGGELQEPRRPKEDFEVRWDGDHDPMNPRSMGTARKWIIVIILSASSLCVYVACSLLMPGASSKLRY